MVRVNLNESERLAMLRRSKMFKPLAVFAILVVTLVSFLDIIQDGIGVALNSKLVGLTDEQMLASMGSRNATDVIKPFTNTTYIQPENLMLQNGSTPFMVILVTSVPNGEKIRNIIRRTWYQWKEEYNLKVFFFIGEKHKNTSASAHAIQTLKEENAIYKDLIVDDFKEGYYRLTLKTLLMLKWFLSSYDKCSLPKYLVKTDQDVFINIPNLVSQVVSIHEAQLSKSNSSSYFIGGEYYGGTPLLQSNPNSKYYVTPEFWNMENNILPNYVAGPCYILSGNIVESIYNASFSVPLFPFEDAYLTGFVSKDYLNLTVTNVPYIVTAQDEVKKILESPAQTIQAVSLHSINPPEKMQNIYATILKTLNSCSSSSSSSSMTMSGFRLELVTFLLTVSQFFT